MGVRVRSYQKVLRRRQGEAVRIERISDDDLECRECGKVGRPRIVLWLQHQCGHCVPLCVACFRKLAGAVIDYAKEQL